MRPLRTSLLITVLLSIIASSGRQVATSGSPGANTSTQPDVAAAATSNDPAGVGFRDWPKCPEMVVIPAGRFTMGSTPEEKQWAASHGGSPTAVADESPQHQVALASFALGKYDVTRGEYAAFVRETGYPAGEGCGSGCAIFKWEKDSKMTWQNPGYPQTDRDPVVCVSRQDARAYIAWLNRTAHRNGAASANGPYRNNIMGFRVARARP